MRRIRGSVLAIALCALVGDSAVAQPAVRLGPELQVNTYTEAFQQYPAVAMDADGDFVVVWFSSEQDDYGEGIFAQRFNATGSALASEFRVNSFTTGSQRYPAVARDADGDFVVAWESIGQDGAAAGVFARRFNAAGLPQASEFQVNSYTTESQRFAKVAMDSDGDFVVAWQSNGQDGGSYGIFARRFNASGVAQASELQVNAYTSGEQSAPAVGMDSDGDFVVTWESDGQDGFEEGIFARRFGSAGSPLAAELQVSSFTADQKNRPAVDLDSNGDVVIAWEHNDGNFNGIFAQRFGADGSRVGAEFRVNDQVTEVQGAAAVALDDDGDFVVVWNSYEQDGSANGVFGRRFDSAGSPQSGDFQVNSYTAGIQRYPAVAIDGDGDFVVAWNSYQDGSGIGVFAQRFAILAVLDADGNGVVGALTDGLLVLRHLFGFTGTTLTAGVLGAGCTRCAPGDITAYLTSISSQLNVDGNASSGALTDGILVVRFLFGFTGTTLTDGAVGPFCSRCAASTIIPYLQNLT